MISGAVAINGSIVQVGDYDPGQDFGIASGAPSPDAVAITGNAWKIAPVNYTVTPDTALTLTYASSDQGEISAVGFETNAILNSKVLTLWAGVVWEECSG